MSSTSVFKSLRELFPQVDLRILRAISIEHEDSINEAVEFILSEVLPTASTTSEVSCIPHENNDLKQISLKDDKPSSSHEINYVGEGGSTSPHPLVAVTTEDPVLRPPQVDFEDVNTSSGQRLETCESIAVQDDKGSSLFLPNYVGEDENGGLHSLVADSTKDPLLWPYQLFSADATTTLEQRLEAFDNNDSLSLNISHLSEKVVETLSYKGDHQHYNFELLLNGGCDNIIVTDHTKLPDSLEYENTAMHANDEDFQERDGENVSVHFTKQAVSSAISDKSESQMNYGSEKEDDHNIQLNSCDELSGCSTDTCRPLSLIDLETIVDSPLAPASMLSITPVSESDRIYQNHIVEEPNDIIEHEMQNFVSLDESSLELPSNDHSILLTSLATRSGHIVCTDLLEDSVTDAKNSKKTLVSTLESMVNMIKEVEFLEEKAKQVEADTSVANKNVLSKVEELQKIVKQSKDEKDMYAGEVYGERSILAAEARELQSRLLKMSVERSEYLSITEQIFKALEARKAAVQDEITATETEKREKEEQLQKALKDHELMMNSLLAESQKLQLEAEENNKLREFLMDRGRVVDSLQGEIAIVFEDIISLKQKIDGHAPLSKYLSSSSWSSRSLGKTTDHQPLNTYDHIQLSSSTSSSPAYESSEEHQQVENITVGKDTLEDWEIM